MGLCTKINHHQLKIQQPNQSKEENKGNQCFTLESVCDKGTSSGSGGLL